MSSEENEMEVDEAPTRNGNVFAFEPLGINVYAEIEETRNKLQKMKARITQRDKEYRSRKGMESGVVIVNAYCFSSWLIANISFNFYQTPSRVTSTKA